MMSYFVQTPSFLYLNATDERLVVTKRVAKYKLVLIARCQVIVVVFK